MIFFDFKRKKSNYLVYFKTNPVYYNLFINNKKVSQKTIF
jgi:hypothetical protein